MRVPAAEGAGIYAAARRWADDCLVGDGSLFTPGREIWSPAILRDLHQRFIDQPDESSDAFHTKLGRQLDGASSETIQLMGEVLFVHFLIAEPGAVKPAKKQAIIDQVLGWMADPPAIPQDMLSVLRGGVVRPGAAFHAFRPFYLALVIEAAESLKRHPDRSSAVDGPWSWKSLLAEVHVKAARRATPRSSASRSP